MQWTQLFGKDYNPISTSRPGIDNSTAAVPTGLYQFEIGTNLTTGMGIDTTISIPVLLRMGVSKNTELQVGFANKYLTLGLLYGGISNINGLENSIIFSTSLTKNNDSLSEYSIYLPIRYSFKSGCSIGSQLVGTFFNNVELDPIINYSLSIMSSFGDKTSWFFEVYQAQTIGNETLIEAIPISVDYGITYLSDNNIQYDMSMGLTIQKDDSDYTETERFFEWGIAFRLPD